LFAILAGLPWQAPCSQKGFRLTSQLSAWQV
jgi:hypothetical protein